jgi:hypothetical protein
MLPEAVSVSNVAINGEAVPADHMSYDQQRALLEVRPPAPGLAMAGSWTLGCTIAM